MKALLATTVGLLGASWFHTRSDFEAQAWSKPPAFSQEKFQPYKLVEVQQETHNVKRFRFALGNPKTPLNLPLASCISLRYVDDKGEDVVRPYTPLNLITDRGSFELLVKCYPNSKMGSHLFNMKVGDTIDVKGPWQSLSVAPSQFERIGMIAGGTGVTPMYQIAHNLLAEDHNKTTMSLLLANNSKEDVLLEKELDDLAAKNPGKFVTYHCLAKAPHGWTGFTGYVTKEMIAKTMPPPAKKETCRVLVSGPPPFMKAISGPKDYSSYPPKQGVLSGYLKEMGYDESCVYKF